MSASSQWSLTDQIMHFKNLIWVKFAVYLYGQNPYHSHAACSGETVCIELEPAAHPCTVCS